MGGLGASPSGSAQPAATTQVDNLSFQLFRESAQVPNRHLQSLDPPLIRPIWVRINIHQSSIHPYPSY